MLGQRVADIGRAFGMQPMFAAHKGRYDMGPLYTPLQQVPESSDVITLLSPLTPDTRGMIGMPEFRAMKRRPILINTARGSLLMRVASRPNVIVTPHVAWASDEAQQALADQLIDHIEKFAAGRPTNLVGEAG